MSKEIEGIKRELEQLRAMVMDAVEEHNSIKKQFAELKAKLMPSEEILQIKQEITELKKENTELKEENFSLKAQIQELWDKFTSFCEKKAIAISENWSALFTKKKDCKPDTAVNENSNTLQL